jgi:hypothetical protein
MSKAQEIVAHMLDEAYDEHVKAHERVQKWDKAHATYHDLMRKKMKAAELFRELGRSIGYERALARVGLTRADVSHPIYGAQIGSVDNYKKTRAAKVCQAQYCGAGRKPQTGEVCRECGGPLTTVQVPYSFTDLHNRMPRHMLGVETNDGRRVWFDEPLPPQPELQPESEPEAGPPKPISSAEMEQQKRLGKWW